MRFFVPVHGDMNPKPKPNLNRNDQSVCGDGFAFTRSMHIPGTCEILNNGSTGGCLELTYVPGVHTHLRTEL